MNLYLIERHHPADVDYGQNAGHVVAAVSEQDARRVAADYVTTTRGVEGPGEWTDDRRSRVTLLGTVDLDYLGTVTSDTSRDTTPFVILTDYTGG